MAGEEKLTQWKTGRIGSLRVLATGPPRKFQVPPFLKQKYEIS